MTENPDVFEGKSFQDLMKEIHGNCASKRSKLENLMQKMADMCTEPAHAAMMAPLFKDLMDVSVKNDDHLVKMATIVQRTMVARTNATEGNAFLTDDDKKQLMDAAREARAEEANSTIQEMEDAIEEITQGDTCE